MSNLQINIESLSLDAFGRVVLTDALLEKIEYRGELLTAGANLSCPGTANGGCTNGSCGGTLNGSCTNQVSCSNSANLSSCGRVIRQPGE